MICLSNDIYYQMIFMPDLNNNAALNELLRLMETSTTTNVAAKWSFVAGNSVEYTWDDGAARRIVTQIVYKQNGTAILVQNFTYNGSDEITEIEASTP